jgi:hypothetical protein
LRGAAVNEGEVKKKDSKCEEEEKQKRIEQKKKTTEDVHGGTGVALQSK